MRPQLSNSPKTKSAVPNSKPSSMSDLHPPPPEPTTNPIDPHPFAAVPFSTASAAPPTKRQRRLSIRLGDIGEQPAASVPYHYRHRPKQPFKLPPPSSAAGPTTMNNPKATKTRTLYLHHPNPNPPDDNDTNLETLAASIHRRNPNPKFPKRSRKIRSCWTSSKPEEEEEDEGFCSEFDDFRREDSLPPQADPLSETNGGRDWNEENHNGNIGLDEDGGVRSWLNRLGLGCDAAVFEIHEVDDEVLPLLTVEDLKDMGINAVWSRRKMYCAIQKLKKNFNSLQVLCSALGSAEELACSAVCYIARHLATLFLVYAVNEVTTQILSAAECNP